MITRILAITATVTAAIAAAAASLGALTMVPAEAQSPSAPFSARVYATREGLIGQTTANGRVIRSEDLFAALPSRLGLSGRTTGERSVQVCAGGRCIFVPVWDVGPWNTKDDYRNAARQTFKDLPRGVPAAQAAYQKGYNKGRDEFGRVVSNPAGLDLSDRAFQDGLALRDNAWVQTTYLWTGAGPQGTVTTDGSPLLVRSSPAASGRILGYAARPISGTGWRPECMCRTPSSRRSPASPHRPVRQARR